MRFLMVAFSAVLLASCAANHPVTGEKVEKVYEVSGSKSELYNKSLDWVAQTFNDSKSVIQVKDADRGRIIGKGVTNISIMGGMSQRPYGFTMQIDTKDNKARIQFTNLVLMTPGYEGYPAESMYVDDVKAKLNRMAVSYEKALMSGSSNNW